MPPRATDEHGQITGSDDSHQDPEPTDEFVPLERWPDAMPDSPLVLQPFGGGMPAAEQLWERGFCHFKQCFTPEFIEELRVFVDEGQHGVSKFYADGVSDFSKPSGAGNIFQGDQLAMSFREEAKTAVGMACGSALARLVAWPRAIQALQQCGVAQPKLWAGYILSKGAGGRKFHPIHTPAGTADFGRF